MSNRKIERISSDIKRHISEIMLDFKPKEIKQEVISVLRAQPSTDLSVCKVYVSIMGNEKDSMQTFAFLKSLSGFFRKELAQRAKLRRTPEIKFYKSDFLDYGEKIEKILKKIKTPQEDEHG